MNNQQARPPSVRIAGVSGVTNAVWRNRKMVCCIE